MKVIAVVFALIAGVVAFSIRSAPVQLDSAGARVPLDNYIQGHATGNGDFMRKAFHTDAKIMAFRDGKLTNLTSEEFASRFDGKPAADEAKRKRSFEILDVSGSAAIARVVLDYPSVKFTDYMTLLKIDGEWKIINKAFHSESKQQPKK